MLISFFQINRVAKKLIKIICIDIGAQFLCELLSHDLKLTVIDTAVNLKIIYYYYLLSVIPIILL